MENFVKFTTSNNFVNSVQDFYRDNCTGFESYDELLASLPVTTPWQHPDGYSGLHLYVIRLRLDKISHSHLKVFDALRDLGIGVNLHYIPVHTHPFFQHLGFKPDDFPQAQDYYREAISLPMFQTLTDAQQDKVLTALEMALTS